MTQLPLQYLENPRRVKRKRERGRVLSNAATEQRHFLNSLLSNKVGGRRKARGN